ncbi:MAG: hypothetical protein OEW65_02960, partial [Thermoleophilia bacterium]|nr:hypothetical protein [Thermoleophilia bacterium]
RATDGLRPLDKYLEGMPEIRAIQDALIERAHNADVPVIENTGLDASVGAILDLVLTRAGQLVHA